MFGNIKTIFGGKHETKELYIIGHLDKVTQDEREQLAINSTLRGVIVKTIEKEIAKQNAMLQDSSLSNDQIRFGQGFIAGLSHIRSILKSNKVKD